MTESYSFDLVFMRRKIAEYIKNNYNLPRMFIFSHKCMQIKGLYKQTLKGFEGTLGSDKSV